MSFVVSSILPETEVAGPALEPALVRDMARICRQLGVQTLRASVVDISSRAFRSAWSINEHGELTESPTDSVLDSLFAGASNFIAQLPDEVTDDTRVNKLSPRRWAFAWRIDADQAVIAEAHFHDRRDLMGEIETAMVRLVCSATLRSGEPEPVKPMLVWPHVERRSRPKLPPRRIPRLPVALAGLTALLCLWLALVALPQTESALAAQQAQAEQKRKMSDATLVRGLSTALAANDYGDAQTALSQFAELGYFKSAVVTNVRGRVVALAGLPVDQVRVGDTVPAAFLSIARPLELGLGSERYGSVLQLAEAANPPAGTAGAKLAAWGGLLAAVATAALLTRRLRRKR